MNEDEFEGYEGLSEEQKEKLRKLREQTKHEVGKDIDLTLTVDRTPEMKALHDENAKLKAKLQLIAQREFESQRNVVARKLNMNPEDIKNPQDLKSAKETLRRLDQQSGQGGSGQTPLSYSEAIGEGNDSSFDVPLLWRQFESQEQLVQHLRKIAKNPLHEDHAEASQYLKALLEKELKRKSGSEYELENLGDVSRGKKPKFKKVK